MTFKKDYINYLLYTVICSGGSSFRDNYRLRKLVDTISSIDDVMKVTYMIGKTAGLELLFKYMLYISDKIDKSQVTIFNLKDNFEYDKKNITRICEKISQYAGENVHEAISNIDDTKSVTETGIIADEAGTEEITAAETENEVNIKEETEKEETENTEKEADNLINIEDAEELAENTDDDNKQGLTLIENVESYTGEAEVFELESISESVENADRENTESKETEENIIQEPEEQEPEEQDTEEQEPEEQVIEEQETGEHETELQETDIQADGELEKQDDLPEIEIEVKKPSGSKKEDEHIKEESITNEAYYKFETKFFEEVKILEKLITTVDRECRTSSEGRMSEKCLPGMTEIIGITSELSNLSRQLSFDLIADIFLTMNIYFTKSISMPALLTRERIKLLDSSLALVNSLIKGEDYLNYDTIVDRIEKLKQEISKTPDKAEVTGKKPDTESAEVTEEVKEEPGETSGTEKLIKEESEEQKSETLGKENELGSLEEDEFRPITRKPELKQSQIESATFKLKYLIREFEKSFNSINGLKGEYRKFDALEIINDLNNALRLIAKISAIIRENDVLKLAEVTYVFLKYVKDYRMDMQEPEIQQIVKYIIFTFKMLLTSRKPEDFNVLVQHLNNPVKIFADS